jgi:hypothetical protein
MKKIFFAILGLSLLSMSCCIKDVLLQFTPDPVIEFDAAGNNAATSPFTYKVLLRHPKFGRPETTTGGTADPVLSRTMADPIVKLRVNLVGPQMSSDQTFTYTAIAVTPGSPNLLAVAGTHYTTSGTFTIPANSSYGEVVVNVLNTGVSSTSPREVHLELAGNGSIGASENYKRIALRIAQN